MSDRDRPSGYDRSGSYRGGYHRPHGSSPYASPYPSRGGYGRGGYDSYRGRGGYDRGRGAPRGGGGGYRGGRGDYHGGRPYDREYDYGRRDSGTYTPQRGSEYERPRESPQGAPISGYGRPPRRHEPPPKEAFTTISPWVKLLGLDQGERVEAAIGSTKRAELDELKKQHQGNFIKIKASDRRLKELEKETMTLGMQLSMLEANIKGLDTFKSARLNVIDSITMLGD